MSDYETMSDFPHPFVIGPAPSQASQAAAFDFLSYSTERVEAIRALVRLPPDVMASILLANIPVDDSMDRKETKKIFEALDYVKAGIQHRAKHRGVYFCDGNVKLPDETFIHVLGFLDKRDLIDNISHVSFAWAKASLSPTVRRWQTIVRGGKTKIQSVDLLLQMLQRPQFTLLKKLVVYFFILNDSLIKEIALVSPRLEELRSSNGSHIAFSAETLRRLPYLFPELNRIGVRMERSRSTQAVIRLVKMLGKRLVGLEVDTSRNPESGFTDDDFVIIGRNCPNLRNFSYESFNIDPHVHSVMTERGLAALIEGCQKLEELELTGTCRLLDIDAFGYIALNTKSLRFLDVSLNWTGRENDEAIRNHFATRLERTARDDIFRYSLLPLP